MLLRTYYPLPDFPPISLTAERCNLRCKHCVGVYLRGMIQVSSPKQLISTCLSIYRQGASGVLLSGGCDIHGKIIELSKFIDAIKVIKRKTSLIVNLHPGLIDKNTATKLNVDFVSVEIPTQYIIDHIYRLNAKTKDYINVINIFLNNGIDAIPHIMIYRGDEYKVISMLKEEPKIVVVIIFVPTKNTPMANAPVPDINTVIKNVQEIKKMYPRTSIMLGCMRPRNVEYEISLINEGIHGIVSPKRNTVSYALSKGYKIKKINACCALPKRFEDLIFASG